MRTVESEAAARRDRSAARLLTAVVLALGLWAMPAASVRACSCASLGGTVEAVQHAELALIGTVVDIGRARADAWGPVVPYAFEVERASAQTPAVVVVHALDDGGGASCGFVFGAGERWLVGAHRDGSELTTGLCSGNARMDAFSAEDVDRLVAILPFTPAAEGSRGAGTVVDDGVAWLLPVALGVLVVAVVGILVALAFRDPRPAR
ncbi:MAG TPA: hypothetical protein VHQ42_09025 [Candidatus Limnocylindria bacterium]|nr:hypothetical protein [Candidatus Limnocylindria bacterium]